MVTLLASDFQFHSLGGVFGQGKLHSNGEEDWQVSRLNYSSIFIEVFSRLLFSFFYIIIFIYFLQLIFNVKIWTDAVEDLPLSPYGPRQILV